MRRRVSTKKAPEVSLPEAPDTAADPSGAPPPLRFSRSLLALILGQVSLHSCMTGVRVAAPLQLLAQGHSASAVGLVLALFGISPVLQALWVGRLADRHGYHRPLMLAVALAVLGASAAALSSHWLALCVAALLCGSAANMGLITIQRSAGQMAATAPERVRIFSWLGLAPASSNVLGPVLTGLMIDAAGFRWAFGVLALLPLAALAWARQVPHDAVPRQAPPSAGQPRPKAFDLFRLPGFRRVLMVNWAMSTCWDLHAFLVPLLGHQRGFSASAIGTILGTFAAAVAGVRLIIPLLAHRLRETQVLGGAMLAAGTVMALYPWAPSAWAMGACALALGLAQGAVQPMIMSALHHLTPDGRHGEAVALRSVTINVSSTSMPLLFGLAGGAVGASALFWLMAAMLFGASRLTRRLAKDLGER
jgi:predicted MFS family arabinose efflux permease